MRPAVDSELDEGPLVDQQGEPLARGQLLALVLLSDLLLAAAELDLLAALAQVVDQRAQDRALGHLPVHCGSLFSKNAFTPSTASSVDSSIVSCAWRNSSASWRAMSCWRNIASFPSRITTGDLPASLPAHSATAASN